MNLRLAAIIILCPILCPLALLLGVLVGAALAIWEIVVKLLDAKSEVQPCGNPKTGPQELPKTQHCARNEF